MKLHQGCCARVRSVLGCFTSLWVCTRPPLSRGWTLTGWTNTLTKKLENTSPNKTSSRASLTKHVKTSYRATRKLLHEALDPGHASLLEITHAESLLSPAQMNALEFQTRNGVARSIAKPDRMIFDLNPGDKPFE